LSIIRSRQWFKQRKASAAELRQHVGARSVVLGEWFQQILLVVLLYLMVFKPG
jgi:hypothetical protein